MEEIKGGKRIPSLDGFRAISIVLVVISHFRIGNLNHFIDLGNLGVRIFFWISAFLIIDILIKHKQSEKPIFVFYINRFLRIIPALWLYFALTFIILYLFGYFEFDQIWRALFFIENYHPRSLWSINQWPIGHIWSLSVEEQFYLIIAPLVFFIDLKSLRNVLITILVAAPLLRISHWFIIYPEILSGSVHRSFETVMDSLAMGGIFLFFRNKFSRLRLRSITLVFMAMLVLVIQSFNSSFFVEQFGYIPRFIYNSFGITIQLLIIGVLVFSLNERNSNNQLLYRFLNAKSVMFIGILSYSIYLWQQIWLFKAWDINPFIRILGIFITATLSYFLVEKPVIKRRGLIIRKIGEKWQNIQR